MSVKLLALEAGRRDKILNAALKEFASRGYDKASTNVIAKEAGLSKPLLFHYVGNKQELFLAVFDYFSDLMTKEYFERMNYEERDIFKRLQQSYLLQINLVQRYPSILEFKKLEQSPIIDKKRKKIPTDCDQKIFAGIDITKFRKGLDIEKSKELILWANLGFTDKILNEILSSKKIDRSESFDAENILKQLDDYFAELKKLFYKDHHERQQ